jgi:hypothetical protein
MHATFTQFVSPKLGFLAGKIFAVDAMRGELTGNYRTQFENTGLTFPMAAALVPISAYGGGVVALPWKDLVLTTTVLDPDGSATDARAESGEPRPPAARGEVSAARESRAAARGGARPILPRTRPG